MFSVLKVKTYRHLFLAQVVALLGTGLATVALSLLAFELAGKDAGQVLGTALTIKMLAYVFVSPVTTALIRSLPRRGTLVALDLTRASVALALPFVSEVWHVYVLIFVLQATSASFTPLFQSTIPDVLEDEEDYDKALSLSRLAYDLESLMSPTIAGLLLLVVSWHSLFFATVIGFVGSALLVITTRLPLITRGDNKAGFFRKVSRGTRFYLATPRLRGLLALNVAVTTAGAMVFVNTVVIVQSHFGLSSKGTALALACFGVGSMVAAFVTPVLLKRVKDRTIMLMGSSLLFVGMVAGGWANSMAFLLPLWFCFGLGYSFIHTPAGRLLTRSANRDNQPDLFAAQFSLSHACWLVAYPVAGWLGSFVPMSETFFILSGVTLLGTLLAAILWPSIDPIELFHNHDDLPLGHPHLEGGETTTHSHKYVVDELHPHWPR